jgi:hypothetical protein
VRYANNIHFTTKNLQAVQASFKLLGEEVMSTPQATLYRLESRVSYLCSLLEGDEDNESLVDRIKRIELENADIMAAQQRMENLLNIIIQLLSHKE